MVSGFLVDFGTGDQSGIGGNSLRLEISAVWKSQLGYLDLSLD